MEDDLFFHRIFEYLSFLKLLFHIVHQRLGSCGFTVLELLTFVEHSFDDIFESIANLFKLYLEYERPIIEFIGRAHIF